AARPHRAAVPAAAHRAGRVAPARGHRQADRAHAARARGGAWRRGRVVSGAARVARTIAASHPAFPGHFPGAPLLPGVSRLAEVLEAARAHAEPARRLDAGGTLAVAKFLAPVRPGAEIVLALDWDDAGLRFEVRDPGGAVAAKGQWRWASEAQA